MPIIMAWYSSTVHFHRVKEGGQLHRNVSCNDGEGVPWYSCGLLVVQIRNNEYMHTATNRCGAGKGQTILADCLDSTCASMCVVRRPCQQSQPDGTTCLSQTVPRNETKKDAPHCRKHDTVRPCTRDLLSLQCWRALTSMDD